MKEETLRKLLLKEQEEEWEEKNDSKLAYIHPATGKRVLKGQVEAKREKSLIKVKKAFSKVNDTNRCGKERSL